jgi:hypothetical protein
MRGGTNSEVASAAEIGWMCPGAANRIGRPIRGRRSTWEGNNLLTRGHLIGQIVDDLAGIAAQAKQRGRLHLFDIHTYVEDFAKEVLNRALGLNLINLNAERSNNPGLDLGDTAKGWAFQVTADKSGAKVKATLEAVDADQRAKYPDIRVLVVGEKQGSYTFDGEPFAGFGFKPEMVWDFNDVCSRIMSLPIDALSDLADYVSRETRRVRIELEVPDEEGRYPTDIEHLIEALPKPRLSDASRLEAHFSAQNVTIDRAQAEKAIASLSARLGSSLSAGTRRRSAATTASGSATRSCVGYIAATTSTGTWRFLRRPVSSTSTSRPTGAAPLIG